jgi:hypothetical protein
LHPLIQNKLGPEHRWELIEGSLAALDIPMKLKDELFPGALLHWVMKPSEYQ